MLFAAIPGQPHAYGALAIFSKKSIGVEMFSFGVEMLSFGVEIKENSKNFC